MGVVLPLGHGLGDARDGIRVGPVRHARRVDADEVDAVEREANGAAVAVDEALALEGVADNGDVLRPVVGALPKLNQGEEHVVIRIQRPGLGDDAANFVRPLRVLKVGVGNG